LILVRGNHDRHAGDPPAELNVHCVNAPYVIGPFALSHHPVASDVGYTLAGHIHPGIRLYGRGGDRARLPCFYFGREYGVLPAFGDFTGLADIDYRPEDRIYAVTGTEVIPAN
jgi:metallophosphoesterase superfamily enzyme